MLWVYKRIYRDSISFLLNGRDERLTGSKRVIAGIQIGKFGRALWLSKRVYLCSIRDLFNRRYGHLTGSEWVIADTQIDKFVQVRSGCLNGSTVVLSEIS